MFKYSKAITAKTRSCTSNTTLLADDGQNCVSLEHLMITTSKSLNVNNQAWLPMYSKTQYTGNPLPYPAMQSKPIQLFPLNNSQTRSQTSTIFGKFNVSFTIINFLPPLLFLAEPFQNATVQLYSLNQDQGAKQYPNLCPTHPCPSK